MQTEKRRETKPSADIWVPQNPTPANGLLQMKKKCSLGQAWVAGGVACSIFGFLLQVVGVATPAWTSVNQCYRGLWQGYSDHQFYHLPDDAAGGRVVAAGVFGILGYVSLGLCFILGVVILYTQQDRLPRYTLLLGSVASFFILVEIIIFVSKFPANSYSYSFVLTVFALVFSIITTTIFAYIVKTTSNDDGKRQQQQQNQQQKNSKNCKNTEE